jgi:hypothetical protein
MKKIAKKILFELIREYEKYSLVGKSDLPEAVKLLQAMIDKFDEFGLAFCPHNVAFYGSKHYEKRINKSFKRPISKLEYEKLTEKQKNEFEKLYVFPFRI